MNKFLLSAAACVGVLACTASYAADLKGHEFSANVAITTDYRFRGISQTNEDPAVSGGFDYSYTPLGFYAGVWASSLDFAVPDPDDADLETDFYGGFTGEFNGIGWDVGGIYYAYPGSDTGPGAAEYDYVEIYGSLSRDFKVFNLSGGLNYSPDYFFESDDGLYVYGDIGVPLPYGISLAGHVGHQSIDNNAQFGTPDYYDWHIGLSKEIGNFTFDISYVDTDISKGECFGGGNICDATAMFTVSASF
ncbi:MAG: TorF family putative porin [Gammaproteobacteria bacterium]